MYKELGFDKHAGAKLDAIWSAMKKAPDVLPKASKTIHTMIKDTITPWGFAMPGKAAPIKAAIKDTVKKPGFGRGAAVGVGAGVVGAMGMNSLFGDKKRNSPYYPS